MLKNSVENEQKNKKSLFILTVVFMLLF